MQVQPYLFFDGRCEEALKFYEQALGARLGMMMRFKDNPEQQPSENCSGPAMAPELIMHASFTVGDSLVMASDGVPAGQGGFKGISLSLSVKDDAEARRVFEALGPAGGGQVQMPLAETFFATSFGMVADRFGVAWMVVAGKPMG